MSEGLAIWGEGKAQAGGTCSAGSCPLTQRALRLKGTRTHHSVPLLAVKLAWLPLSMK